MKCVVCKQLERRLIGLGYLQHLVSVTKNAKYFPEGIVSTGLGTEAASHFRVDIAASLTIDELVECLVVRGTLLAVCLFVCLFVCLLLHCTR